MWPRSGESVGASGHVRRCAGASFVATELRPLPNDSIPKRSKSSAIQLGGRGQSDGRSDKLSRRELRAAFVIEQRHRCAGGTRNRSCRAIPPSSASTSSCEHSRQAAVRHEAVTSFSGLGYLPARSLSSRNAEVLRSRVLPSKNAGWRNLMTTISTAPRTRMPKPRKN